LPLRRAPVSLQRFIAAAGVGERLAERLPCRRVQRILRHRVAQISDPLFASCSGTPSADGSDAAARAGADAKRYTVGNLRDAVAKDPLYSAAWKALGKALADAGRSDEALEAYRRGVEAAKRKGDKQAEREMTVFARRLERQRGARRGKAAPARRSIRR